jgi:tetratricopeptide (TPR) repeat protein
MIHARIALLVAGVGLVGGCIHPQGEQSARSERPRLFDGLGRHHRAVTTASREAQQYFDQGLVWVLAFNHDEAIRSFSEAARLDPGCAMAWWGIALAHGPHINNVSMTPESSAAAWHALQECKAREAGGTPVEHALIDALSRRYASPAPADRRPLDEAYAAAMREVHRAHPDDADAATLFAESMMILRPWDLWKGDGTPHPGTTEIISTLEVALRLVPDHPGANHLYIHALEASPRPEQALAAADRLCDLVPASGHLVHMPSHIYSRTGRWQEAAGQNIRAVAADRRYRERSPRQGFYRIYMAHNHHFLAFACMMSGRSRQALEAARDMLDSIPPEAIREQGAFLDPVMGLPLEVMMRFGRWEEILRQPAPPAGLPISRALFHWVRGIAFAARGEVDAAVGEEEKFLRMAADIPPKTLFGNNTTGQVFGIARHILAGEIAYRRDRLETALEELRAAVALEDELIYNDPPDWIQPARHTLGAILLAARRHGEAERVYREDLARWPENGWSLAGLTRSLRGRGAAAEADEVERRFRRAWSAADLRIGTSCLCVREQESP